MIYFCSNHQVIFILACKINYHHNFYVQSGIRNYYSGIPDILQVAEHQFVERKLVNLWITLMVVSWTSATNCARFYNVALRGDHRAPPDWQFGSTLNSEHVYNGFIILSLLEDRSLRQESLSMPHGGLDKDRYKVAMQARNIWMRLYSQPELQHYCKKCTRFLDDGSLFQIFWKCPLMPITIVQGPKKSRSLSLMA